MKVEKRSGGRHLVGGGLREENGKVGERMGKGMGGSNFERERFREKRPLPVCVHTPSIMYKYNLGKG